jgi:ApaG protein
VITDFLDDQSVPAQKRWFWSYHIRIENHRDDAVKLLTRHWKITDGNGRLHEVRGEGVVGEQPCLQPGGSFTYTSGCPLETPQGIMVGTYEMENAIGERFLIDIPAFSLDMPSQARVLH